MRRPVAVSLALLATLLLRGEASHALDARSSQVQIQTKIVEVDRSATRELDGSYMIDRASGLTARPVQSVPDASLQTKKTQTTENLSGSNAPAVPDGGLRLETVPRIGPDGRILLEIRPERDRFSYATILPPQTPTLVDSKTTQKVRTEYDDYGLGNVVKVERLYTTTENTFVKPPAVYRVDDDSHRRGGREDDENDGRDHGRRHDDRAILVDPGQVYRQIEREQRTLSAERATLPGQNYVRMADSAGKVYLVSRSEILRQTFKIADSKTGDKPELLPGFGWTPRPIRDDDD